MSDYEIEEIREEEIEALEERARVLWAQIEEEKKVCQGCGNELWELFPKNHKSDYTHVRERWAIGRYLEYPNNRNIEAKLIEVIGEQRARSILDAYSTLRNTENTLDNVKAKLAKLIKQSEAKWSDDDGEFESYDEIDVLEDDYSEESFP